MASVGRLATWCHGRLHFVDQGQHIADITGIPHRQLHGEDEARGGLGDNARFAAKLGGAVALAFANGGNGGIVGIDDFTLGQGLALGEAPGLGGDLLMGDKGHGQLGVQARPLLLGQLRGALHLRLRGPRQSPPPGSRSSAAAFPSGAPSSQTPCSARGTGGQSGA